MPTLRQWFECENLPVEMCRIYQRRHGKPLTPIGGNATTPPPDHQEKPAVPPNPQKLRGLGDVVDAVTTATGVKAVVKAVAKATGRPCGCEKRRERLNQAVPFKGS